MDTEESEEPGAPEFPATKVQADHAAIRGEAGPGLVLVATPIGNLGDISARAIAELSLADSIACEDTRHTRKLLSALGISGKRLLAVHEHNEKVAADGLISLIRKGERIVLVSDAGTPGLSDPGEAVAAAVALEGLPVTAIPGASALLPALTVSGLPTGRFAFEGFLPRSGSERSERLSVIAAATVTMVLYESPNRVAATLHDLVAACGEARRVSVSRELTKRFEHTWRGSLGAARDHFRDSEQRGEFVLVIEAMTASTPPVMDDAALKIRLDELIAQGMRTRDAVDAVAAQTGANRRHVYAIATAR